MPWSGCGRASRPSLPFIADAKRGDIGSTAAQYAVALYDSLDADAVTASPYLGSEAIAPLLDRADRFVYLLCRTSNPGALELQGLVVAADPASGAPAEPLALRVARLANGWARHTGHRRPGGWRHGARGDGRGACHRARAAVPGARRRAPRVATPTPPFAMARWPRAPRPVPSVGRCW